VKASASLACRKGDGRFRSKADLSAFLRSSPPAREINFARHPKAHAIFEFQGKNRSLMREDDA
jgi:hypothetical protein